MIQRVGDDVFDTAFKRVDVSKRLRLAAEQTVYTRKRVTYVYTFRQQQEENGDEAIVDIKPDFN